jgi:hypothetical protein
VKPRFDERARSENSEWGESESMPIGGRRQGVGPRSSTKV